MRTKAELQRLAGIKRSDAERARRWARMLGSPSDQARLLQQATDLDGEAAALEAEATTPKPANTDERQPAQQQQQVQQQQGHDRGADEPDKDGGKSNRDR